MERERNIYPVKSGILSRIPSHHFHIFAKRPGHSLPICPKLHEHLYILEIESRNKSLFDSVQIFIRYLIGRLKASNHLPLSNPTLPSPTMSPSPTPTQETPKPNPSTASPSPSAQAEALEAKKTVCQPFSPFSESQPNDQAKRLTTTSGRSRSQDCSSRGPDPRDGRKSEQVGCAAKVSL